MTDPTSNPGEGAASGETEPSVPAPAAQDTPNEPVTSTEQTSTEQTSTEPEKPAGTPAKKKVPLGGRSKPAKKGKAAAPVDPGRVKRRDFVWWSIFAYIAALALATVRFFFPRVLFEPRTRFPIGFAYDYAIGVDTKWQGEKRIWVVRDATKLYVILARCTHLGCTPDWKPGDNKFKCPCHGSGFTSEGVNFEGPAPQPLFRVAVETDARGEIIVDKAREYPFPRWTEDGASIPV